MVALKLAKLPARTPIRVTISVSPGLHHSLESYADCYREIYGEAEKIADLIPFMLEAFLASDKEFAKSRKSIPHDSSNNGEK